MAALSAVVRTVDLPLPIRRFPPSSVRVRPSEGRADDASQVCRLMRARFTEEQIIGVLREHEAGAKTADLARKHGVSEATLYSWKAKFGGMDVSEAKQLRQLEGENAKLKKLLAEQMLNCRGAARAYVKKMVGPVAKCEAVAHLQTVMDLSERRACCIFSAHRKMVRYGRADRRTPNSRPIARACQWPPAVRLSPAVRADA